MKTTDPMGLTPEQKRLFDKLKEAYKSCEKAGIYFANNYGSLQAYNKSWVSEYADTLRDSKEGRVMTANRMEFGTVCPNWFKIASQWTDDMHLIRLTNEGLELFHEYHNH